MHALKERRTSSCWVVSIGMVNHAGVAFGNVGMA